MNWFSNSGSEMDSYQESNDRPGKFHDIAEFMNIKSFPDNFYISGTQAPVDPGQIIYIKDPSAKDTRINDRVMLVLFHNPPFSYTCLSFCHHYNFYGKTLQQGHALVYTDRDEEPNTSLLPLKIQLQHNRTPFSLQPDIYLNLRELWNVEQDVQFVVLGQAERGSYEKLRPKIVRLFSESLAGTDSFRDIEPPPAPNTNSEEPVVPERKPSRSHNGRGKEKKRSHKSGWHIGI